MAVIGMAAAVPQEAYAAGTKTQMMEEIYEGAFVSGQRQFYTQQTYPVTQWESRQWIREMQVNYLHGDVVDQLSYEAGDGSQGNRVHIKFVEDRQIHKREQAYMAKVRELAVSQEGKSVEEKARFFHDYLINACEYDSSLTHMDAYDCLIGGSAVCNGYATAFHNLMDASGEECEYIAGQAGGVLHAWNRVRAEDGSWRYIDVTWDDSLGTDQYFFITKEEMEADHVPEYAIHGRTVSFQPESAW